MATGHRVIPRNRPPAVPPSPPGHYEGRTFVDTDGTEYEVVPLPSQDWPCSSHSSLQANAVINLRSFS
jgi:hypothetical protein